METYAKTLLIAIPGFIFLLIIEAIYARVKHKKTFFCLDTISGLSSGMTSIVKNSLGLMVILVSYPFLYDHIALLDLESTWFVYVVGFVCIDFAGYWAHRLEHSVNLFWNKHVIHHSSEEFNLACGLRQTISNIFWIYVFFLAPAAILGVPEKVIAVIAPIQLFFQFWYHTRLIPKLGWLEYLIITPSQHRVHHAINPEYLDKNLGQIFPWWDRLFGTYQEELDDVQPVYGVTRPVRTWNPIIINYQHVWLLAKDAWRAQSWKDKLRIWFMPTGWRPADVEAKYPVNKIEDIYHFEKYRSGGNSRSLITWSWFQMSMTLALVLFMFWNFGAIEFPNLFVCGGLLVAGIFGYTSLMDMAKYAVWVEIARSLVGLTWIAFTGEWFGLGQYLPGGNWLMIAYFIATAIGAIHFHRQWAQENWTMAASRSSFS